MDVGSVVDAAISAPIARPRSRVMSPPPVLVFVVVACCRLFCKHVPSCVDARGRVLLWPHSIMPSSYVSETASSHWSNVKQSPTISPLVPDYSTLHTPFTQSEGYTITAVTNNTFNVCFVVTSHSDSSIRYLLLKYLVHAVCSTSTLLVAVVLQIEQNPSNIFFEFCLTKVERGISKLYRK